MGRILHYGLLLMIMAVICAGALATVNKATKGTISEIEKGVVENARKEVLPSAKTFNVNGAKKSGKYNFIPGMDDNGNTAGYVVDVAYPGYAGDIKFVLGVGVDGKITGLKVVDSKETPGLGAKVNNKDWQDHWIDKEKSYTFDKSVDGFAGATISPRAVYSGTMEALSSFEEIKGK